MGTGSGTIRQTTATAGCSPVPASKTAREAACRDGTEGGSRAETQSRRAAERVLILCAPARDPLGVVPRKLFSSSEGEPERPMDDCPYSPSRPLRSARVRVRVSRRPDRRAKSDSVFAQLRRVRGCQASYRRFHRPRSRKARHPRRIACRHSRLSWRQPAMPAQGGLAGTRKRRSCRVSPVPGSPVRSFARHEPDAFALGVERRAIRERHGPPSGTSGCGSSPQARAVKELCHDKGITNPSQRDLHVCCRVPRADSAGRAGTGRRRATWRSRRALPCAAPRGAAPRS